MPGWQQGIPDKHHLAAKTQLVLQGRGGLRPMRGKNVISPVGEQESVARIERVKNRGDGRNG